jgi:hypothetical protein
MGADHAQPGPLRVRHLADLGDIARGDTQPSNLLSLPHGAIDEPPLTAAGAQPAASTAQLPARAAGPSLGSDSIVNMSPSRGPFRDKEIAP